MKIVCNMSLIQHVICVITCTDCVIFFFFFVTSEVFKYIL